jgi:hypothetical protein
MPDELKVTTGVAAFVCIPPIDGNGATVPAATVGWVDMSAYRSATFYCMVGVIGAGATGTFTVQQAGVKTVGAKTQAYTATDDGTVWQLHVDSEEMDVTNSFRYVRVQCACSAHSALIGALIVREGGRYAATEA